MWERKTLNDSRVELPSLPRNYFVYSRVRFDEIVLVTRNINNFVPASSILLKINEQKFRSFVALKLRMPSTTRCYDLIKIRYLRSESKLMRFSCLTWARGFQIIYDSFKICPVLRVFPVIKINERSKNYFHSDSHPHSKTHSKNEVVKSFFSLSWQQYWPLPLFFGPRSYVSNTSLQLDEKTLISCPI